MSEIGSPDRARSPDPLLRRYRWNDLTEAEKDAVKDCVGVAATRAGVGLGLTLTLAALLSHARRGKPALPAYLRYSGLGVFSFAGAYVGFMSGGGLYARRILALPNSRLADDLRIVIDDWQSRKPIDTTDALPHEPLPQGAPGTGHGKNEIIPRDPKEVRAEQRRAQEEKSSSQKKRSWTDRIGLTKT